MGNPFSCIFDPVEFRQIKSIVSPLFVHIVLKDEGTSVSAGKLIFGIIVIRDQLLKILCENEASRSLIRFRSIFRQIYTDLIVNYFLSNC